MNYDDFLRATIELGIDAARRDYTRPEQAEKLRGSLAGFEACRGKWPGQLNQLYDRTEAEASARLDTEDYLYWRCRHLEVEWVCNVVSAMLVNQGLPPTRVAPTARGVMTADKVLRESTQ